MRLITAIMGFCIGTAAAQILLLHGCKEHRNTVATGLNALNPHYIITQSNVRYYGSEVEFYTSHAILHSGNKVTTFYGTFVVEAQ